MHQLRQNQLRSGSTHDFSRNLCNVPVGLIYHSLMTGYWLIYQLLSVLELLPLYSLCVQPCTCKHNAPMDMGSSPSRFNFSTGMIGDVNCPKKQSALLNSCHVDPTSTAQCYQQHSTSIACPLRANRWAYAPARATTVPTWVCTESLLPKKRTDEPMIQIRFTTLQTPCETGLTLPSVLNANWLYR